ncbi:MAG TPA: protein translocase subunit SecDF [Cytophagaceae bacterium]
MRNKTGIIVLTAIVTLLSLYFLSFSLVSRKIQRDAIAFATDSNGEISYAKKQSYLDSIYNEPVYNFLGIKDFTYKEVKENELNLGLDLQGGMHVTLEVSPVEVLRGLAGPNKSNPNFEKALQMATERQKNAQVNYTTLFFQAYKEIAPNAELNDIFGHLGNKSFIDREAPDSEVRKFVEREVENAIDRTYQILKTRIDKFGVISPNIYRIQGTGRIQVELPGADNPQRVRNLLQGVAKLEFLEVASPNAYMGTISQINDYLLTKEKLEKTEKKEEQKPEDQLKTANDLLLGDTSGLAATDKADTSAIAKADSAAVDSLNQNISSFVRMMDQMALQQAGMLVFNVKDTAKVNKILADPKVQGIIGSNIKFLWEKQRPKPGQTTYGVELVPVEVGRGGKAPLTGEVITNASYNIAQNGKGYEISMSMNSEGARKWKNMTAKAIEQKPYKRIAIVLDNVVYSAPTVQSEIPNGMSSITGDFTEEDAKDLANILKAGKLPASPRIVEEGIIGPSLGVEAINSGLMSSVAGLALVVIFMLMYYGKGGAVANLALVFNIFFILGVLAQLGAVLTLPGIAGIVLTIGMAVDANVLIFERIREELGLGKSLSESIKLGYGRAFWAIFDSNVTTLLIGIILFLTGSGPVQGFATTLIIGIFCSFFTAVYISRVIISWLEKKGALTPESFDTFLSRNLFRNTNFNFIGNRKKAYIFSSVLIGLGFIAILVAGGLTLGVDFKGGRSYIVEFNQPIVASEVRSALVDNFEGKGTEVKTYGSNQVVKVTTSYLIDDESAEADETVLAALNKGLEEFKDLNPSVLGSTKVGATIADDIKSTSAVSVILSLAAIFLYILARFRRWQFGLGSVVALAHDALVCFAVYGFAELMGFPLEIDQIFIGAILTLIGYSINDTVVVFDRVRENLGNTTADLTVVMNTAINQTLSRTVITATTTLIVSLVLFIFGGEILRGLSLVLIIATTFGTYSSIFIAASLILDLRKKQDAVGGNTGKKELKKQAV